MIVYKQINRKLFRNFQNPIFLIIMLIIIIGAGLRLYNLGVHDLWYDEALSAIRSGYSVRELVQSSDPYLSFYYIFLHSWKMAFGDSEFVLRFPSVIFGLLSIIFIYKLGKILVNKNSALFAAFIMSISPLHLWYAQEARPYTMSVFFVILASYYFVAALRENRHYQWMLFILASVISIYLHYFSALLLFSEGIFFINNKNRHLFKKWLISCAFIVTLFIINRDILMVQFLKAEKNLNWWTLKPKLGSVLITFENFNIGYNGTRITYLFSTVLFLLLFILGIYHLARSRKESLYFLLLSIFIPVISIFAISSLWRSSFYLDRYLMIFSGFYYLIVATGIAEIKSYLLKVGILLVLVFLIASSIINYFLDYMPSDDSHHFGVHYRKPFKLAVQYIKENWEGGDLIFHSHRDTYPSFIYYQKKCGLKYDGKGQVKRIWLISNSWRNDGQLQPSSSLAKNKLGERYLNIASKNFDGIYIDLYLISNKAQKNNNTTKMSPSNSLRE